jgi:hypothetical protein
LLLTCFGGGGVLGGGGGGILGDEKEVGGAVAFAAVCCGAEVWLFLLFGLDYDKVGGGMEMKVKAAFEREGGKAVCVSINSA